MKKIIPIIYFSIAEFFLISQKARAGLLDPKLSGEITDDTNKFAGSFFNTAQSPGSIIASLISAFLGLLGIIFVILIIYAGYCWMTASGEEAKVTKAKETIQRAIIGLIIIAAAYTITAFVFKYIPSGDTGGGIEGHVE